MEHVDSPRQAVSEAARVLRPDGLYLYDTINCTVRSKLLMIKLFQDWKATAFMEPNLHDHQMFIRPREMDEYLRAAGLEPGPIVGLATATGPAASARPHARPRDRTNHLRRVQACGGGDHWRLSGVDGVDDF